MSKSYTRLADASFNLHQENCKQEVCLLLRQTQLLSDQKQLRRVKEIRQRNTDHVRVAMTSEQSYKRKYRFRAIGFNIRAEGHCQVLMYGTMCVFIMNLIL